MGWWYAGMVPVGGVDEAMSSATLGSVGGRDAVEESCSG